MGLCIADLRSTSFRFMHRSACSKFNGEKVENKNNTDKHCDTAIDAVRVCVGRMNVEKGSSGWTRCKLYIFGGTCYIAGRYGIPSVFCTAMPWPRNITYPSSQHYRDPLQPATSPFLYQSHQGAASV
jgi:hypothetical protein